MKNIRNTIILVLLLLTNLLNASEWYKNNRRLKFVFPEKVWIYIEKADFYDSKGDLTRADSYLRLAKRKTDEGKPFNPHNWPKGWPQKGESLKLLKYASPEAYLYRIMGDFAYQHKRPKEALINYSTYQELSIIPDTDYMMKMANIFENEKMWRDAKVLYEEVIKSLESKNFHGKVYSNSLLTRKIDRIKTILTKPSVLTLNTLFRNIPEFIKEDIQKIVSEEINSMENYITVNRLAVDKSMSELEITVEDLLKYEEELSNLGKMVNANYILRPVLTRIDDYYIFQVDVFDPSKIKWLKTYEYKTESYEYLHNFVKRFTYQFQNKDIPENLFIPENKLLWSYEADSFVTDFSFSENSKNIIIGTESGLVSILNSRGTLLRKFNLPEKIVKVSISPCGQYFSWTSLNGILYFASLKGGISWKHKVNNYARGIDIANDGRFLVYSINNEVVFKDKKGETFWKEKLPQWVSSIKISNRSDKVFIGMENGQYWAFSDEGNVLWKKNLNNRVFSIKVSKNNYNCAVTVKGRTFLFDEIGNEIINFEDGQDIQYSAFSQEILKLMTGKKGNYFYLLSQDKKKLWRYDLSGKTSFISTLDDGTFLTTVEGKNIFSFKIIWL